MTRREELESIIEAWARSKADFERRLSALEERLDTSSAR